MQTTLILNGSPHPNGDTAHALQFLTAHLNGSVKQISAYTAKVAPCTDCRRCKIQTGCAIEDEMQQIYPLLENCDNLVLASPLYFSELTGPLLSLCSRLQTYFSAAYFRNAPSPCKPKKASVLLVGGGTGNPEKAYNTARCVFRCLHVQECYPMTCCHATDHMPVLEDALFLRNLREMADFLNTPLQSQT